MTFEELKEKYKEDIELSEDMVDNQILQLPKIMARYQFFYSDLLQELSDIQDKKDIIYHQMMIDYKQGNSDFSNISFNASELKQMLVTSPVYRKEVKRENELTNQLKLVEEMLSNIKSISYSWNSYLTYKKLMMGII